MNKKIAVLFLALIFSLTGCTQLRVTAPIETPEAAVLNAVAELPSIGVVVSQYDDGFLSFVRSHMVRLAEGRAHLTLLDSRNSQSKQLAQIDTMISKGVQALAVNLVAADSAQQVIEKVQAAGLPVVFFGVEPDAGVLASYDRAWYVGTTPGEAERILGGIVARSWRAHPAYDRNGDGIVQLFLMGPGSHDEVIRALGLAGLRTEVLAANNEIATQPQAAAQIKSWLEDHSEEVEFVVTTNDYLALGAVDALMTAGFYNSEGATMPVVGMESIPQTLEVLRQGQMQGSVLKDALGMGAAVTELSCNVALGYPPLQDTVWALDDTKAVRIPYVAVTADSMAEAMQAFS